MEEEDGNVTRISQRRERKNQDSEEKHSAKDTKKKASNVTPIRQRKTGLNGMEVCIIKPTSIDDAREITETLLSNRTVILNVEGLDIDIAQRIIDFSAGSCYAINGNLQKISSYIIIISPENVDISGDVLDFVDSFQTSGLHADL